MADTEKEDENEQLPQIPPRPDEPKKPGRPAARPSRPPPTGAAKPAIPTTRPTIISARAGVDEGPKKPPPVPPSRPASSASPKMPQKPSGPAGRPAVPPSKDKDDDDDEEEKPENTKKPPTKPHAPPTRPGPPPRPKAVLPPSAAADSNTETAADQKVSPSMARKVERPARPPMKSKPQVPETRPRKATASKLSPPKGRREKEVKDDKEDQSDEESPAKPKPVPPKRTQASNILEKEEPAKPKPDVPVNRPPMPKTRPEPTRKDGDGEDEPPEKPKQAAKPKPKPQVPETRPRKGTASKLSPPKGRREKEAKDQSDEESQPQESPAKPKPAPPKRTQASNILDKEEPVKPKPAVPVNRPPMPETRPESTRKDRDGEDEPPEKAKPAAKPRPPPPARAVKDDAEKEESGDAKEPAESSQSAPVKPAPPKRKAVPTERKEEDDVFEDGETKQGSPPEKKRNAPPKKPGPPLLKKLPPAAARPPPPKIKHEKETEEKRGEDEVAELPDSLPVRPRLPKSPTPEPGRPPPPTEKREGPSRPRPLPKAPPKRPSKTAESGVELPRDSKKVSPIRRLSSKSVELAPAPELPPRPGPSHPLFRYVCNDPHGIATCDYFPENEDELQFSKSDFIVLLSRVDENWLMGRNVTKEGMFPKAFVKIVKALPGEGNPIFPSAIAIYDFETESPDELAFFSGEIVRLLERVDDAWFRGSIESQEGIFPADFVEILVDLPVAAPTAFKANVEGKKSTEPMAEKILGPRCQAKFDFSGENESELSFTEGMEIKLLEHVSGSGDWLRGSIGDKEGIFPASFVEILVALPKKVRGEKPKGNGPWAVAEFDFVGENVSELSFRTGQSITVLRRIDDEWLEGELNGEVGRLPVAFVKLDASAQLIADGEEMVRLSRHYKASTSDPKSGPHCIASYDFDGQDGELSFKTGDLIVLMERVNDEWLRGTLKDQEGIFPVGFVEIGMDLP